MPAPSRIQLVLLDVGNVLVHLKPWPEILEEAGLLGGVEPAELLLRIERFASSEEFDAFEKGRLEAPGFCESIRKHLGLELEDGYIEALYREILGEPIEGMVALVDRLHSAGLRVGGLSDTSPFHLPHLEAIPAVSRLERLVTSCETGFKKPDPRAYHSALERLGAEPGHTLFVDDREDNVLGAREAGLEALRFTGTTALMSELERRLDF